MSHESCRQALELEFSGEPLSADDAAHLAACEDCQAYREQLAQVDDALAGGGLGPARVDALEARLFARLGVPAPVEREVVREPGRAFVVMAGLGSLLAAVVLFFVIRPPAEVDDSFSPRGAKAATFGVRAFCVEAGKVVGEAHEGQTVRCGAGQVLQLSYTAAEAGRLSVSLDGVDVVFPRGEDSGRVERGIDVPLPFSTPVGAWLEKPRELRWRFEERAVSGSLTIAPR